MFSIIKQILGIGPKADFSELVKEFRTYQGISQYSG